MIRASLRETAWGPIVALQFLTRWTLHPGAPCTAEALGKSMAFFPLVGMLIGAFLVGIDGLSHLAHLPAFLSNLLLVGAALWATGAIHLDGLADTADGLGSGRRDPAQILAIMRDSRLGTMGTLALFLALAARLGALAELEGLARISALLLAPACGRWIAVLLTATMPYAAESGKGEAFTRYARWPQMLLATLSVLLLQALLQGPSHLWLLPPALLALAALARRFFMARLGGITGDTLGATIEVVELVCLMAPLLIPT